MSWYDKSRAVGDELLKQLPEEYFCLHDGDELGGSTFDVDDIREEAQSMGPTWEFASYVRSGLASPGKGQSKFYHYSFPESLYPVFSIETGKIEGVYTAYSTANSRAVDAGDDYRFCQYIRYDRVTMRTWSDNEKQSKPDDQLGIFNISGDKVDPIERMSPDTFQAYKEATNRPMETIA